MIALRLLQFATIAQVLLGLARFGLPYLGVWLDGRVWQLHPLNGIAITAAALVLFRPLPAAPSSRVRTAARFAPLLALALGLGMASLRGLLGPVPGTFLHMAVGLAAVELIGRAATEQARAMAAGVARSGRQVTA
jgi:hypothetical protein